MDADGGLVSCRIPHFVHIAYAGGHRLNIAGQHFNLKTRWCPAPVRHAAVGLTGFAAAQHAHQTPYRVVMDGCGLAGCPHKADH